MPQVGEQGKQAAAILDMYAKLFQAAKKEVSAVGVGLRLDKQGVLHLMSHPARINSATLDARGLVLDDAKTVVYLDLP